MKSKELEGGGKEKYTKNTSRIGTFETVMYS